MSDVKQISLKRREGKVLKLVYKDSTGTVKVPVDVSTGTFSLYLKEKKSDTSYKIEKNDGDFNKTEAASGIVKVPISSTDTDLADGVYVGEAWATFPGSQRDISQDIRLIIEPTVYHPPS